MHASPGEIVRRCGREVWMEVRSEIGETPPYARLVVGVYHSLALLTCGLIDHDDVPSPPALDRPTPLGLGVEEAPVREPRKCYKSGHRRRGGQCRSRLHDSASRTSRSPSRTVG